MTPRVLLLVEDDPDDRELTLRAFARQASPPPVEVAGDGQEALDYLLGTAPGGTPRPLPAVVLLDLKLPRVDGLEVLRRLRAAERTRLVPVVVLSSSAEERDVLESYARGANGYVQKPVSFTALLAAAEVLGGYWLRVNRTAPEVA
jgi:two-component system response regulator